MDEDDWLDSAREEGPGGAADPLVDREYERISTRYADAGYREGITDGKLSTLQEGFDQSFALSVPSSRRLGNLRGRATALLSFLSTLSNPAAQQGALNQVRALLQELNSVKRNDILSIDEERLEHERVEHPDETDAILDVNDDREMEGLEEAIAKMDGRGRETQTAGTGDEDGELREERLLDHLERRLQDLSARCLSRPDRN